MQFPVRIVTVTAGNVEPAPELQDFEPRHLNELSRWAVWERRFYWQEQLLAERTTEAVSPFTGRLVRSSDFFSTNNEIFFIEFIEDGRLFVLVASNLGLGHIISGLILPDRHLLVRWHGTYGVKENDIRTYLILREFDAKGFPVNRTLPPLDQTRPSLFIGHENFAHFMHNHLAGLDRILAAGRGDDFEEVVTTFEPLGPTDILFPELKGRIRRLDRSDMGAEMRRTRLVPVGDVQVSTRLRERVAQATGQYALRHCREVVDFADLDVPKLMFGVRLHSRVVRNNQAATEEIARRIAHRFGRLRIFLDGFSAPADMQTNPNYSDWFHRTAAASANENQQWAAGLRTIPGVEVFDLAATDVRLALYASQRCDAYFSNIGTQQHKAGWLSHGFGVVHAQPSDAAAPQTAAWFNSLVPAAPDFIFPPAEFVVPVKPLDQADAGYAFSDVGAMATWFLNEFEKRHRSEREKIAPPNSA